MSGYMCTDLHHRHQPVHEETPPLDVFSDSASSQVIPSHFRGWPKVTPKYCQISLHKGTVMRKWLCYRNGFKPLTDLCLFLVQSLFVNWRWEIFVSLCGITGRHPSPFMTSMGVFPRWCLYHHQTRDVMPMCQRVHAPVSHGKWFGHRLWQQKKALNAYWKNQLNPTRCWVVEASFRISRFFFGLVGIWWLPRKTRWQKV